MDVFELLDDQWAFHKPVTQKVQLSPPLILKAGSPLVDQAQLKIHHSLSDGSFPLDTPQVATQEDAQKLREYLSAPDESLPSVKELPTEALSCPEEHAGEVPSHPKSPAEEPELETPSSSALTKESYSKGLGPAPPLVTAVILLLMPLWLPVLAFFFLPLVFTWAFIAGVSLATTAFLNVVSSWWRFLASNFLEACGKFVTFAGKILAIVWALLQHTVTTLFPGMSGVWPA